MERAAEVGAQGNLADSVKILRLALLIAGLGAYRDNLVVRAVVAKASVEALAPAGYALL